MATFETQLLQPPKALPDFTVTAQSLLSDAERIITENREFHASLVKNTQPSSATFHNVLTPLAQAENDLITGFRMLIFYESVSTDAGI